MWTGIGMLAIACLIFVLIQNGDTIGMRLASLCKNPSKLHRLSNVWLGRTLLILAAGTSDLILSPIPEIVVPFGFFC